MDYKDSLLMPQTDFSMRGNLPENEKVMQEKWDKIDIYNKMLKQAEGKPTFILHDGPPYANGNIHLGHAFNKIIKDFVNRYKAMEGYQVIYIPGWDVHGLPIETAITKSGVDRKSMGKAEFRELCTKYAEEQIMKQMADFKTLSVIGDWDNYYATFQFELEAKQIEIFAKMAKDGLIFKGLKPVYWSPSSESALAEAEIEYKDRKDPSIYVAFEVVTGNNKINTLDNLIIWTTTPWTLPGNLAICAGEDIEYVKVKVNNKYYILAYHFLEELAKDFAWESYDIIDTFKGKELAGVEYEYVFGGRTSPVIFGDHVTLDAGTGLVHTAPGYGVEDFTVGNKYNLGLIAGVDDKGCLTKESGEELAGLFYEEANKQITQKLESKGSLLKLKFITHSYPHDWRTKQPVIFRATDQWFCTIESIKDKILDELDNAVHFHTPWGKTRLYNMIKDRGDWCISRQRVWGVPIPIFYNEDGSEIMDYDVMMHVADLFRKHGSNVWFERDAKDLLPEGYSNPASPNGKFRKEEDIMDVWFDSGCTHTGVLEARGLPYPSDLYLEGSDQYRGWFNSSLICGVAAHGKTPYKALVSHGFTLDEKGYKQSKSLGNTVEPNKVIKTHGADVLRLWVASVDFTEDFKLGDEILAQVKESYRKIRNTYRFMLGNLFDYEYSKDRVNYVDMLPYDQYMMIKLNQVTKEIKEAYENYNFDEIYKLVNNFVASHLSNFYLDFTKDILYIEKANSKIRRSVQTVLYETLYSLIRLLAPILPYTSEEVYQLLPNKKSESIHLVGNPEVINYDNQKEIIPLWEKFFTVKADVYRALEEARNQKLIGKGLEAIVYLNVQDENFKNYFKDHLKQLFIVSKVVLTNDSLDKYSSCEVKVEPFNGIKCERCWNLFEENEIENDICHRCSGVVNK